MKSSSFSKALALIFFALTAGLAAWTFSNFSFISGHIDSNIFSLLPKSERNPVSEEFISRISSSGERSLVVLITSDNIDTSLEAEKAFRASIKGLELTSPLADDNFSAYISLLKNHRSSLITDEDIHLLDIQSSSYWYDKANSLAYSMGGLLLPWGDDPFGLSSDWLYKLGRASKVHPYGDSLVVDSNGISYVVIPLEASRPLGSIQDQNILADGINVAIAEITNKFRGIRILRSGVAFIASDTSKVARDDISTIGLISAIAAFVLIASIFRSFYAIAVVMATVSIAFLYAVLACLFIFPKIYILTLAFGTSLIGMSVDYCLYWLTASIDDDKNPLDRRRYLLPGMFLALITTAMGYCLLAITPFPVLSQMAVFSIGGIISAWLTVILIFPYVKNLRFHSNNSYSILRYIKPGFLSNRGTLRLVVISLVLLLSLYGAFAFKTNDDIRSLASFDKGLINEQLEVSKILDIPSPSQFFIVRGSSESDALDHTETLSKDLDQLVSAGYISGYQSITQYLPSIDSQKKASASYTSKNKEAALRKIAKEMGMNPEWVKQLNRVDPPLTMADLKNLPIYKKLSFLWFDSGSGTRSTAVLLMGLRGQPAVEELARLANSNVTWVDKPQEISQVFHRYRTLFSYIVLLGYLLTFIAIYFKFKSEAWRAVLPPVFATLITLSILSMMGETIGLLSVIAFALLLGVGTDYGIFLLQYPNDKKVLFSISIAALMTLISFGSLSLSSIPALHSFGIALLFGIFLSWLLTIFFARRSNA